MLSPFEEIVEAVGPLGLPRDVMSKLPRRWERLGDVLLLKVDERILPYADEVLRVYAEVLRAKAVLRDMGIEGRFREPRVELLYGSDTLTVHRENGIAFHMDPSLVMFSSGNIDERMRMSTVGTPGEMVVDMFAGIGYFIVPMAVRSRVRGMAFELNPNSYGFLVRNVDENGVSGLVETVHGDCLDAPERIADRVLMGYLSDTPVFLEKAMRIIGTDGGTVHCHTACPRELIGERTASLLSETSDAAGRTVTSSRTREIKSYAPGVAHIVIDIVID